MTVQQIQATLRRVGQRITLRRITGKGNSAHFDVDCIGVVQSYQPRDLVGPIQQGDRRIYLGTKEIADAKWPGPPLRGDKVITDGREYNVEAVDDAHSIKEDLAYYVLQVRG